MESPVLRRYLGKISAVHSRSTEPRTIYAVKELVRIVVREDHIWHFIAVEGVRQPSDDGYRVPLIAQLPKDEYTSTWSKPRICISGLFPQESKATYHGRLVRSMNHFAAILMLISLWAPSRYQQFWPSLTI